LQLLTTATSNSNYGLPYQDLRC